MSEEQKRDAPWWVYVIVIVGANLGKNQFMPEDSSWTLTAISTLATIAVAFAVVKVVSMAVLGGRAKS